MQNVTTGCKKWIKHHKSITHSINQSVNQSHLMTDVVFPCHTKDKAKIHLVCKCCGFTALKTVASCYFSLSVHRWQSQNSDGGQPCDTRRYFVLCSQRFQGFDKGRSARKVRRRKAGACLICAATSSESSVLVTFLCLSEQGWISTSLRLSPVMPLWSFIWPRHTAATISPRARRGPTGGLAGLRQWQARGRSGISFPRG